MKVTLYTEPDDLTLAARAAKMAAAGKSQHNAVQFGEGASLREFHSRRTTTGAITVWQVANPSQWPE